MRRIQAGILIIILCWAVGCVSAEEETRDYFPMPKSNFYPKSAKYINNLIHTENQDQIRQHGWALFELINRPVKKVENKHCLEQVPIWQTWFSEKQVFTRTEYDQPAYCQLSGDPQKTVSNDKSEKTTPHLSHLKKGATSKVTWHKKFKAQKPTYKNNGNADGMLFANNGDIMIAGEYFNLPSFNHIRKKELYLRSELNKMLKAGMKSIPTFPKGSIVTKSMYWPVAKDEYTALPVWDNMLARPPYQYNGYETWKRSVAVQGNIKPVSAGQTKTVKSLYNVTVPGYDTPRSFQNSKVVSVTDFYNIQVDAKMLKAMDSNDITILNNSAKWAYNREFQAGDYLVLIALHILTKEIEPWTYQSFWWHDQPDAGPFATGRPTSLPNGKWQNYLMAEAYSQVTPREYDGSNHVAYNPYIELVIHPVPTNCQNCHARASLKGKYDDNPSGRRYIGPNDKIFKNDLRTDYLWIISDRAIPPKH
ncbi:MAG: hypothetical protein HOJ79_02515 [Nitrospina sp.]|jgi:hypothetical protein|nr:hypothetical protein [Nitrospina sp.]